MTAGSKEAILVCSNIKSGKGTSVADLLVSRLPSSRWNTEKKIWHDTIYDELKVASEGNSDVLTKSVLRTYHAPEDQRALCVRGDPGHSSKSTAEREIVRDVEVEMHALQYGQMLNVGTEHLLCPELLFLEEADEGHPRLASRRPHT